MKRIIICGGVFAAILLSLSALTSCEDIDEVPPMKDSSTGKTYKIPDPEVMDAGDRSVYDSIKDEYDRSTGHSQSGQ